MTLYAKVVVCVKNILEGFPMTRSSKSFNAPSHFFLCVCVSIQFLLNMLEDRKVLVKLELACVLLNFV